MTTIDNSSYETYISYTGSKEDIKKFKETMIVKNFFSFTSILPVPDSIAEHPMIEHGCYNALIEMALCHDPAIDYYGNIRDKMSKDRFYKVFMIPFEQTGIKYRHYTPQELIDMFTRSGSLHTKEDKKPTVEDAIKTIREKSAGHEDEAKEALTRMRTYGCATRYSWRTMYWGTPMEAIGCQIKPEGAKTGKFPNDAVLVYTSGGSGRAIFDFMAKRFPKIDFEIIWRRIEDDKAPEYDNVKGETQSWKNGCLQAKRVYRYKAPASSSSESEELDELMDNIKKTFREGWTKEDS